MPLKNPNDKSTIDGPFGLKIVQKTRGYRYSQDSLLLVEFASLSTKDKVADLGTGSGIIPLVIAHKAMASSVVGIEIQGSLAELARKNTALNGMEEKIKTVEMDIRKVKNHFDCRSFDYVISNPPYMDAAAGKITPNTEKAVARHEIKCTMGDVLDAMKYLLKPQKRAGCIYPAMRLAELFIEAKKRHLEPKRLQFIHPRPNGESELAMVEFVKEGNPGLVVLPPIFTEQSPSRNHQT